MPSLVDSLLETFGAPVLTEYFGVSIVYQRIASLSAAIDATRSSREYKLVSSDGINTVIVCRDYVILKTDLVINGSTITPREKDVIQENGETWAVLPLGEDRPGVEEVDGGYRWLLHTKRVL